MTCLGDLIQHGVELCAMSTNDVVNQLMQQRSKRVCVGEELVRMTWLTHPDLNHACPASTSTHIETLSPQPHDQ